MRHGIDVSENNGVIDWDAVAPQIDFAIIRLGYIGDSENKLDSQFKRNYEECKRLGIPIGAYVYSYADTEDGMNRGAEWCLENTQDIYLDLPFFLDLEDCEVKQVDPGELTVNSITFCNYIEESSDFKCGIYASLDFYQNHLVLQSLIDFDLSLWIAHWGVDEEKYNNSEYMMLQYGKSTDIDGIDGEVDVDVLYSEVIQDEIISTDDIVIPYRYQNGSTREKVYSDKECNNQIGFLNPYESCSCLGVIDNRAIVLYTVDSEQNKKIGFVKWLGGVTK